MYNITMINYAEKLRKHSLKATPQRLAICDALHKYGHLNVEELYALLLKDFNSLSLATIYKNINLMMENYFVKEIKLPDAKSVYELVKDSHAHMICEKCKKVEDIDLDMQDIIKQTLKKSNFIVNSADLVLSGICSKCSKNV